MFRHAKFNHGIYINSFYDRGDLHKALPEPFQWGGLLIIGITRHHHPGSAGRCRKRIGWSWKIPWVGREDGVGKGSRETMLGIWGSGTDYGKNGMRAGRIRAELKVAIIEWSPQEVTSHAFDLLQSLTNGELSRFRAKHIYTLRYAFQQFNCNRLGRKTKELSHKSNFIFGPILTCFGVVC